MIKRLHQVNEITRRLACSPVVAILGARQVGKTTLAAQVADRFQGPVTRFDLEDPDHLARLDDPSLALRPLTGLVILDEIQRLPEIFPLLRVLVDRPDHPAQFLVLGSASPELLKQGSETLAGRITFLELSGFDLADVGPEQMDSIWVRGGFPRAYLAATDEDSDRWREDFIRTYLERDLTQLGFRLSAATLRRFWTMVAHCHGQVWNGSRIASSLGVTQPTVRSWLDVLTDTFMVRQLQPYLANIGKRQVKSPKVYLRDTGLLHSLLGLTTKESVEGHPIVGTSWEGFAMEQVITHLGVDGRWLHFWSVHSGAEIDLVVSREGRLHGFEFKRTLAPKVTPSMRSALKNLDLESISVVYPGAEHFSMAETIAAVPLYEFAARAD